MKFQHFKNIVVFTPGGKMAHKKNRSSTRSKRMIREAFLELLSEKEFDKITVTDIANRADLNRSTFYAYYPDVVGIVEEIQDENIQKNLDLIHQMQYRNIWENPIPYLQSLTSILEESLDLYARIGHTAQIHRYLDRYRKLMADDIINDPSIPEEVRNSSFLSIRIHFFLGGIMNSYQQWADGTLSCSLDEISNEISEIIKTSEDKFTNINFN